MPYRILIANRGEIAVRIARTLIENGYIPVGVYTSEDSNSLHRKFMVEDVEVSSYLEIKEIISAASELGADALHPGYGFLSENPEFAREVIRRGLVFIGPSPQVMALSGDKIASKVYAEKLEVPTLPWNEIKDPEDVLEFARSHGYPLIIKAAGGGGGRGVRVVWSDKEVDSAVKSARAEAERAFKDPRLYVEPYIQKAKHIEVQILGDGDNIVHLYERECSIQRKYQKVIEEAPSPSLTPKEREKLYDYAVTLARGLRYTNAGTVEFVFDIEKREPYFIEINARLQVEHPVTEMITRVDIVKRQVEIALYTVLGLKQNDIKMEGHAIEARIYAENPYTGEPFSGMIKKYLEPGGPGIRIDTGIAEGLYVSDRYDPLILKVIAWGSDRFMSIRRLDRALNELVVEGIYTNVPLLRQLLKTQEFNSATYTTRFFDEVVERAKNKVLEEAKVHSIILATLLEYDDKAAKTYTKREKLIEQVLSSEKVSSLKRHAWYYYMNVKGTIERYYMSKRQSKKKVTHK